MQAAKPSASKNSRLFIPNISSDYTINYNIICNSTPNNSRKVFFVMLAYAVGFGVMCHDSINGLLFRCHGFIISCFCKWSTVFCDYYKLLHVNPLVHKRIRKPRFATSFCNEYFGSQMHSETKVLTCTHD
jgi:hypothetical protein